MAHHPLGNALGFSIVQEIAYAPNQVTASLNRGVPLVQEYRDSAAARSIMQLAQYIVDNSNGEGARHEQDEEADEVEKPKKRGLFSQRRTASA